MDEKREENDTTDPLEWRPALSRIRRRRWFLWWVILIYVPAMWVTLQINPSNRGIGTVFVAWVLILCVAVAMATIARCPRCGNYFHTNGPTFLPMRKCLHCGLHVNADKEA